MPPPIPAPAALLAIDAIIVRLGVGAIRGRRSGAALQDLETRLAALEKAKQENQ